MLLLFLGIILIFLGAFIAFLGLIPAERVESGGLIIIGPFPIIFHGELHPLMILLLLLPFLMMLFFMLYLLRRGGIGEAEET
ncbi:MAG: TIGR00304 family protein [Thaumarchaeota archaeon]|nr:MAG: TIGR00304 family protein [Nitrososphaerota archaeon]